MDYDNKNMLLKGAAIFIQKMQQTTQNLYRSALNLYQHQLWSIGWYILFLQNLFYNCCTHTPHRGQILLHIFNIGKLLDTTINSSVT